MKLIYNVFIYFFLLLGISFAAEEYQQDVPKRIQQDVKILMGILNRHGGDPFIPDPEYGTIGDAVITSLQNQTSNHNLCKVIQLYEDDKAAGILNSVRLTWLSIQIAMALTTNEGVEIYESPTNNIIKFLKKPSHVNGYRFFLMSEEEVKTTKHKLAITKSEDGKYSLHVGMPGGINKGWDLDDLNIPISICKKLEKEKQLFLSLRNPVAQAFVEELSLSKLHMTSMDIPYWLVDFKTLEHYEKIKIVPFYSSIKMCHLFSQPLAIYNGNGIFSIEDSLNMAQQGIFLYSLNLSGKGIGSHGGVFRANIENTIHDMIHYMGQWLRQDDINCYKNFENFQKDSTKINKIREVHEIWKKIISIVCGILDDADFLNEQEKSKLAVIAFYIQHEFLNYQIPSIYNLFEQAPTLFEFTKKAAEISRDEQRGFLVYPDDETEFYKNVVAKMMNLDQKYYNGRTITPEMLAIEETQESKDILHQVVVRCNFRSNPKGKHERFFVLGGTNHYTYWKLFTRDLGHLLMQKKLWNPANHNLGTTYSMNDVSDTFFKCYTWFLEALEENGKLHHSFKN